MKRRIALGFLAFLLLAIGGALWLASTPWAGRQLCDLASRKVREAAGVEVVFGACRVRPIRLTLALGEVRQQCGYISWTSEYGSRGNSHRDTQLVSNDGR